MVVQMGQRARPGEEVCTVYSANVWVALPTRALHIHTCGTLSQSGKVCPSVCAHLLRVISDYGGRVRR